MIPDNPIVLIDPYGLCPGKLKSGLVCIDFFANTRTVLGLLKGDARGFKQISKASKSRAYAIIDPSSGKISTKVNASSWAWETGTTRSVNVPDDFTVTPDGKGGFRVHVDIVNSKIRGPHINADLTLSPNHQGGYNLVGSRDGYPSLEAYFYRNDGLVQTIIQQKQGNPLQLFGTSDTRVP